MRRESTAFSMVLREFQALGIGIAARELDRGGNPLGRLVELDGAARRRNIERDRAAKHDDAVGRAAGRIPRRKALLQRQHQGIAERR